jgi:hypothetical protein
MEIRDIFGESRCDGQPGGHHVVFHIIDRRVGQHHGGISFPDHGHDLSQQWDFVGQFQIMGDGRVESSAKQGSGRLRFGEANAGGGIRVHFQTAAIATAEVEIINVPSPGLQLEQGASHDIFDVVRMSSDGENGGHK